MKTITSFLILATFFFLGTSGLLFIFQDIADKNTNLNVESVNMVSKLESVKLNSSTYSFEENPTNYSLGAGYVTIAPEDKDNAESKGLIDVILFMKDMFYLFPLLFANLVPFLPVEAFLWVETILIALMGYFFTIAIYNVWKARRV